MATLGRTDRNRVVGWLGDSDEIGPVRRKIQTFLSFMTNSNEPGSEHNHAFLGKFVLAGGVVLSLVIAIMSLTRPEAAAKTEVTELRNDVKQISQQLSVVIGKQEIMLQMIRDRK